MFFGERILCVQLFMNLSNLLVKNRMISLGIHASVLTLLLLVALFINATLYGPSFLPEYFLQSHFLLSLLINFIFFYSVYFYIIYLRKRSKIFSKITRLFLLLLTTIIASVWLDLWLTETSWDLNNKLTRYFLIINSVSKVFYMSSALLTIGFVSLVIQKLKYNHLRLVTAETELAILKTQTNPHFLFNVLNTLYASAYKYGDTTTANGIGQMSALMRYALHSNQKECVLLEQEIEYIEQFIHLQKLRFQNNLTVNFDYVKANLDKTITPMLLMPIIENAFKYSIISGVKICIDISLGSSSDEFSCTVINPDHSEQIKASTQFHESGTGLVNLQKRLELLYPDQFELSNEISDGKYIARLIIKLC